MVAESGLRLGRAASRVLLIGAAAALTSGCVYFNSIYNANKLFNHGRSEIEKGNVSAGHAALNETIEKAERVVSNKPESRWADDAQALIVQARILLADWDKAAESSRVLLSMVSTARDSARAEGFLGMAEARLGSYALADSLIGSALTHKTDRKEQAALLYSRGLARIGLDRLDEAEADLREASSLRPGWVRPRFDRARLLTASGRTDEAAYELTRLFASSINRRDEDEIREAVETLAAADPPAALAALASVENSGLGVDVRARLVKLRADINRSEGRLDAAERDYRLTVDIAPDSRWAAEAVVARARVALADAQAIGDLEVAKRLLDEVRRLPWGSRLADVPRLTEAIQKVEFYVERKDLGYLAAAETARSDLGAPRLARALYLDYANGQPDAPWAPKALLAAIELSERDSLGTNGSPGEPGVEEIRRRLLEEYSGSAYVQALLGGETTAGFSYEELEQGLRVQLDRLRVQAETVIRDPRRADN